MSYQKEVIIGTRGSKLALWQANHVKAIMEEAGFNCNIKTIETKGDKMLDVALSKIGSKGIFTEEIENQLVDGSIHIAVHSAKDLQSELADDFELLAILEREKPNDVLISHNPEFVLEDNPAITIGTSSTRRVAFLKRFYPKVKVVEARGNLQTRIKKLEDGHADALILAYAGVHRMEYDHLIVAELPIDEFVPPTGQGSIAIECAKNLDPKLKSALSEILHHKPSGLCICVERAFLKTMQGGCSIPVFCHAVLSEKSLSITGGLMSLDGKILIKESKSTPALFFDKKEKDQAELTAIELANKILNHGGRELLYNIKQTINHS
jgi:hydroxymethylbilane synthase